MVSVFASGSWSSRIEGRGRQKELARMSAEGSSSSTISDFIERSWREGQSLYPLSLHSCFPKTGAGWTQCDKEPGPGASENLKGTMVEARMGSRWC